MYEIKSRGLRSQIITCFIFLVLYWKKLQFHWKKEALKKRVIVEEELNCIDTNDIRNLEDFPRRALWKMWESHCSQWQWRTY